MSSLFRHQSITVKVSGWNWLSVKLICVERGDVTRDTFADIRPITGRSSCNRDRKTKQRGAVSSFWSCWVDTRNNSSQKLTWLYQEPETGQYFRLTQFPHHEIVMHKGRSIYKCFRNDGEQNICIKNSQRKRAMEEILEPYRAGSQFVYFTRGTRVIRSRIMW
jgi:hypothetical protein